MILLTGANGFVGQAFLVHAEHIQSRVPIRAAVRSPQAFNKLSVSVTNVQVCQAPDLGPLADWSQALDGVSIVVHCAARVHVMQDANGDPLAEYRRVNVQGTLALARQAITAGVKRFVFVSSIKVNGEGTQNGQPFSNLSSPLPEDPYGLSKFEAEQALISLGQATGLEVVVVRPPLVYGPNVKANFASLLKAIQRGFPLPFGLASSNRRSLVYTGNLADLLWVCTYHSSASGQIFLVSDGHDFSTRTLITSVADAIGVKARLVPIPVWLMYCLAYLLGRRKVADRLLGNLQLDISHTCATLNRSPPFSAKQGLKTLLNRS